MKTLNTIIFCIWFALSYFNSLGQNSTGKIPEIVITDTKLYYTLADYISITNAPVVAIFIERSNNEYTYLLYNPIFYDFIEDNPTTSWGRWKSRTILFYTGIETITMTEGNLAYKQLLTYLKPILTNQFSNTPTSVQSRKNNTNGSIKSSKDLVIAEAPVLRHGETIWRLKEKAGKEISLEKDIDPITMTSTRIEIPYIKFRAKKHN